MRAFIDTAAVGVIWTRRDGRVIYVNEWLARLLGGSERDIKHRLMSDLEIGLSVETWQSRWAALGAAGCSSFETDFRRSDGTPVRVEITMRLLPAEGAQLAGAFVRDLSDRRPSDPVAAPDNAGLGLLLDLHRRAQHMPDRDLHEFVLDQAVTLTGSTIGFLHRVSDDQQTILLTTWSAFARETCTTVHDDHYPLQGAGNWADCVRERRPVVYNEFEASPNQRGLPPGHTHVKRFVSVPVLEGDKVRVIFGVGNKPTPYLAADVAQLQVIATELHKVIVHRAAMQKVRLQAALLDQISDAVTATDLEGRIIYANEAQSRLAGRAAQDLIGRRVEEFGSDARCGATHAEVIKATREQGRWSGIVANQDAHGEQRIVELRTSLLRDQLGEPMGMIGVCTEVTERIRMEEKLRASEANFRRIVETTQEGVWVLDAQHRTTFVNAQMVRMLAVDAASIVGHRMDEFLFAEDIPEHRRQVERLTRGEPGLYRRRFRHGERGELWTQVSATPVMRDGRFEGSFAMVGDVSGMKAVEDDLVRRCDELAAFNEAMIGRELRMIELKQEVNAFCRRVGQAERFPDARAATGAQIVRAEPDGDSVCRPAESDYRAFVEALIAGNRLRAEELYAGWNESGTSLAVLYEQLVQRALYEIGARWQAGEISVATEHLATAICESLLNLSYPRLFEHNPSGRTAVVSCSANEHHQIGGKMVADFFQLNGWHGYFLGANTPTEALIQLIRERKPNVVALSLTVSDRLPALMEAVRAVRAEVPATPILVGGQAFQGQAEGDELVIIPGARVIRSLGELTNWIQTYGEAGG